MGKNKIIYFFVSLELSDTVSDLHVSGLSFMYFMTDRTHKTILTIAISKNTNVRVSEFELL